MSALWKKCPHAVLLHKDHVLYSCEFLRWRLSYGRQLLRTWAYISECRKKIRAPLTAERYWHGIWHFDETAVGPVSPLSLPLFPRMMLTHRWPPNLRQRSIIYWFFMSIQLMTSSHGHIDTHQSTCAVLCESSCGAGPFPVTASVEARHAPSASAMPCIRHFVALERGVSGSPVRKSETSSFQTLFFARKRTLYDYWY